MGIHMKLSPVVKGKALASASRNILRRMSILPE